MNLDKCKDCEYAIWETAPEMLCRRHGQLEYSGTISMTCVNKEHIEVTFSEDGMTCSGYCLREER